MMKAKVKKLFIDGYFSTEKPYTYNVTLRKWTSIERDEYVLSSVYTDNIEKTSTHEILGKIKHFSLHKSNIVLNVYSNSEAIQAAVKKLNEIKQTIEELKSNERSD